MNALRTSIAAAAGTETENSEGVTCVRFENTLT